MPPSSQPREEINMKDVKALAEAAAVQHLSNFVDTIADATTNFIRPMNPAESKEVEEYLRKVLRAVDEVVLVATMQDGCEVSRAAINAATELQIANLTRLHMKDETKH